MNRFLLTTALVASFGLALSAQAQTSQDSNMAPVGGAAAKGNAPLKHPHTINDGSARPGANSFTQGQARQHILNSGYTDVSGLTKGQDGVWRGTATHNGSTVSVAMDFKGNVTEAASAGSDAAAAPMRGGASSGMSDSASSTGAMSAGGAAAAAGVHMSHHRHHHHRHHHHRGACAHPGANGVACSGVSTERSGVSDKEEHAPPSRRSPVSGRRDQVWPEGAERA